MSNLYSYVWGVRLVLLLDHPQCYHASQYIGGEGGGYQHRTASHHDATHEHRYTDGSQHLLPYRLQRKQTPAYRQRQYQQEPGQR